MKKHWVKKRPILDLSASVRLFIAPSLPSRECQQNNESCLRPGLGWLERNLGKITTHTPHVHHLLRFKSCEYHSFQLGSSHIGLPSAFSAIAGGNLVVRGWRWLHAVVWFSTLRSPDSAPRSVRKNGSLQLAIETVPTLGDMGNTE